MVRCFCIIAMVKHMQHQMMLDILTNGSHNTMRYEYEMQCIPIINIGQSQFKALESGHLPKILQLKQLKSCTH